MLKLCCIVLALWCTVLCCALSARTCAEAVLANVGNVCYGIVCDSSLQMKNARQEHTTFLAVQVLHNKTACKTRTRLISRSRTRQERAKLFESTLSLVVRNLLVHENWTHLRENVNAVASPIPKNGTLSRNLIGLKSFGLFTKISELLTARRSSRRDSGPHEFSD